MNIFLRALGIWVALSGTAIGQSPWPPMTFKETVRQTVTYSSLPLITKKEPAILAEGQIIKGTAEGLLRFLQEGRSRGQSFSGVTLYLNSPGGNAAEGMMLGRVIRD